MSRLGVQKLQSVFAVFSWSSVWERSTRTNLFRAVRTCDLVLSHTFIWQIASRFMFLSDQNNVFLRTVLQSRLRNALPKFVASSDNFCSGVQGIMHEVVLLFKNLKVRFFFF